MMLRWIETEKQYVENTANKTWNSKFPGIIWNYKVTNIGTNTVIKTGKDSEKVEVMWDKDSSNHRTYKNRNTKQ